MRVPHNAFVLVADARKLLLLRNEGDTQFLNLQVVKKRTDHNPATHEQAADQAGQASSARTAGGAWGSGGPEPTDFQQLGEDRFEEEAAALLHDWAERGDFESLIVVAPPKTLGELRKYYSKEVTDTLTGEIDKDLTRHSVSEIEEALTKAE